LQCEQLFGVELLELSHVTRVFGDGLGEARANQELAQLTFALADAAQITDQIAIVEELRDT
jgi:hypothetical protein